MTLTPSLFPSVGWLFFYITRCHVVDWYQDVYQKQSIRNRYRIVGPNGIQLLSVPVEKHSNTALNSQIVLSYAENWLRIHSKALESSYGKSPFYEYLEADLQNIFTTRYNLLVDLQQATLAFLLKWMGISELPLSSIQLHIPPSNSTQIIDIEPKTGVCKGLTLDKYPQVFEDKWGFIPHVSGLDLLCNEGPETLRYLLNLRG